MQRLKDTGSAGSNEIPQLVPFPAPPSAPAPRSAAGIHWMLVACAVFALLMAMAVAWWNLSSGSPVFAARGARRGGYPG